MKTACLAVVALIWTVAGCASGVEPIDAESRSGGDEALRDVVEQVVGQPLVTASEMAAEAGYSVSDTEGERPERGVILVETLQCDGMALVESAQALQSDGVAYNAVAGLDCQ